MELFSSWGLCLLDSHADLPADAADRARQILSRLACTQERHYSVQILQWMATFFAEQGRPADVRACAAALAGMAEATGQPEAIAALAHARGESLLADASAGADGVTGAAEADGAAGAGADAAARAARELRRAAAMFAELDLPLATAQAQRRAAAAAARAGDRAGALELLRAAQQTAGRLGARSLHDACAAALGQLGGKPRGQLGSTPRDEFGGKSRARGAGREPRAAAGLTGRELEIMLLVARGNTSRQIGETLFISPRTVEMHVQGSLLKLQCRTRAEAVRRLAELGTLPPQVSS
jgi:DNA-binding CsgD family transcriptional regulator